MRTPHCAARWPSGIVCGAALRERIDGIGRLHWDCEQCRRFKAGICLDCPRRVGGVPGRAMRCPGCTRRRNARRGRLNTIRNREVINARQKDRRREFRKLVPPMDPHLKGLLAAAARAAALTPERRREIARIAGLASGRVMKQRRAAA